MAQTITHHDGHHEKQWYDIEYKQALSAGFIAGTAFLIMEMGLVATIGGGSLWGPPRMIAAMVMGEGVLPPPATFELGIFLMAALVHFFLSFALVYLLSFLIHRMTTGKAVLTGAAFGLAVYFVNFYLIAPLAFLWFTMAQNMITLSSHVVFGLVAAWTYNVLSTAEE